MGIQFPSSLSPHLDLKKPLQDPVLPSSAIRGRDLEQGDTSLDYCIQQHLFFREKIVKIIAVEQASTTLQ